MTSLTRSRRRFPTRAFTVTLTRGLGAPLVGEARQGAQVIRSFARTAPPSATLACLRLVTEGNVMGDGLNLDAWRDEPACRRCIV
jgi:hypothetical protein